MIAEGETSDVFYFDTLPTSPPSNLKCESTSSNSLKLKWDDPIQGMEWLDNYAFSYRFKKSKQFDVFIIINYLGTYVYINISTSFKNKEKSFQMDKQVRNKLISQNISFLLNHMDFM